MQRKLTSFFEMTLCKQASCNIVEFSREMASVPQTNVAFIKDISKA